MARSEAEKRARAKYDKKVKTLMIRLYPSEQDLLYKIAERTKEEGYSHYIKRLIRQDIDNESKA